jgi:NitT/TauT family transport system ATP-binding protein
MSASVSLGFVPLVDAAPLIIARELGFAREEGLSIDLHRAAGWSMLRDMLDLGQVDAAQMLSVVPVARALGLGGGHVRLEAPMVLSLNGEILGVSQHLARRLRATGGAVRFGDAAGLGAALSGIEGPLRIGVPFTFSMHTELLQYWIAAAAPSAKAEIVTVPPPRMAAALQAGEIDGFCVGEPWGSHAVEVAGAELLLAGSSIWTQAPEKVLAMRSGWAETHPDLAGRLIRALWRACRWVGDPANRLTASEILSWRAHLDLSPDLIDRALTGRLLMTAAGPETPVPQFLTFHDGAANFPWRSQAAWIGARLARRFGLESDRAQADARATFRSDLYRRFLGDSGAPFPRSSDKAEGILPAAEAVPAVHGTVTLMRNRFFDGQIFDPAVPVR